MLICQKHSLHKVGWSYEADCKEVRDRLRIFKNPFGQEVHELSLQTSFESQDCHPLAKDSLCLQC